jgi:peptide/nickel transport system substrate-binding protein
LKKMLLLVLAALLLAAAAHAGESKLTVALGKDEYITSGPRTNIGKYPLNANIFESLTTFDPHFRLLPCLAESWSYQGNKTWRFNFRKGVRFHDGSLLNAAAVRRSFEKQAESGTMLFQYEKISEVAEFVLDITTPEENLLLPYILSHPYLGIVKADNATIGTGPFKFVRHEKDQLLEVGRNEDYWGEKAKSAGIIFRFLPDNSARMMAFQAGEADVLADLPWEVLPDVQANGSVVLHKSPVGSYVGLMLSLHGPLADKDIRRAISASIDRKAISKALWHDLGETRQTMLAPSFLGADAELIADVAYDPLKVKELLQGKKVQLSLVSGFPNANAHGMLPELLQAQLQAAGIEVAIQKINDAGLYHSLMKEGKGDLWLERGNLNSADLTFLPHLLFHQEGFYPKQLRTAAGNAAFAGFIAKARQAQSDDELRKNTALALREIINQDMLFIPIAELPFLLAAQKNVQTPELHPTLLAVRWAAFSKQTDK